MLNKLLTFLTVSALFFLSCTQSDENGFSDKLDKVVIKDAKAVFIISSGSSSTLYGIRNNSSAKLWEDSKIYQLKYVSESMDTINKENPQHLYDNSQYFVLAYGTPTVFNEAYYVEKTSGYAFRIPDDYLMTKVAGSKYEYDDRFLNHFNQIQEDAAGDMYHMVPSYENAAFKLDLQKIKFLYYSSVSSITEHAKAFCINSAGDIIYRTDSAKYERLKFATASNPNYVFTKIDTVHNIKAIWTGIDGKFYCIESTTANDYFCKIENGKLTKLESMPAAIKEMPAQIDGQTHNYVGNIFNLKNHIVYSQDNNIILLDKEGSFKTFPCTVVANLVMNDNLYYFDKDNLTFKKIDVNSGNVNTEFVFDKTKLTGYEFDKVLELNSDAMVFCAKKSTDNTYIIGKIDTSNEFTVLHTIPGKITSIALVK